MEGALSSQISALLFAFLFGVGIGALYDLYRVFGVLFSLLTPQTSHRLPERLPLLPSGWLVSRSGRVGLRARGVLLFFCDTLFALAAGSLFVIFLYVENDGVFRFYLLAGAALTFFLYLQTVGKLVFRVAGVLALYLHIALLYLAYFLALPLFFFVCICRQIWRRVLLPALAFACRPILYRFRAFVRRRRFFSDLRAAHAVLRTEAS